MKAETGSNMNVEGVSLRQAEQSLTTGDTALWVLNRSSPMRLIILTVRQDGVEVALRIEMTWVPIDLSTQASKVAVLNTPSFRAYVEQGFIAIVSTPSAETALRNSQVREEHTRIIKKSSHEVVGSAAGGNKIELSPSGRPSVTVVADKPSPRAMSLSSQVDNNELTATNAFSLLTNMGDVTKADTEFIMKNSQNAEFRGLVAGLDV